MPERIVVCFRGVAAIEQPDSTNAVTPRPSRDGAYTEVISSMSNPLASDTASDAGARAWGEETYLSRALALKKRAEALGATLCAWSAHTFSFEFAPEDIEEAVLLAALAADDATVRSESRFSVGITQGEMTYIGEAGRLSVLSWGQPLLMAVLLARIAPPGGVLLDPALPAVRSGELMTWGTHRGLDGDRRVRGLRLDLHQPLRRQVVESVARVCTPPLIGRSNELEQLAVPNGSLAILRAEAGAGGSRLLSELPRQLAPSRVLFISPVGASREPLGALRRALARARSLALVARAEGGVDDLSEPSTTSLPSVSPIPDRLQGAFARLLAGDGVDPWTAAELLDAWLAPGSGRFGLLLIDDAAEVDAASLDAVAGAMSVRRNLRCVVRLGRADPLPTPLTALKTGATVVLGPLAVSDAQELVRCLFDGCMPEVAARRWAARARGWPLAVREALCEALESGALRWVGASVEARRRSAGRGDTARTMTEAELAAPPASPSIEGRLRRLPTGPRAILTALAMLGGDASDAEIDALCAGTSAPKAASVAGMLTSGGWVYRPEPGWLKLASRTLRGALHAALSAHEAAAWHLATAGVVRDHSGSLGLADAALHAALAGEHRGAAELASAAARAAGDSLLEASAAELLAFADEQEATNSTTEDSLPESSSSPPPTYRMPIDVVGEITEAPRTVADVRYPSPVPRRDGLDPQTHEPVIMYAPDSLQARKAGAPGDDAHVKPGNAQPPVRAAEGAVEFPDLPDMGGDFPFVGAGGDPLAKTSESPVFAVGEVSVRLVELAKQALLQGDLRTLERLVGELRRSGRHVDLVERMTGFISLGRGAKGDALRRFRAAAEAEQSPAQRARALLAYGVALAAAGRTESALLEALSALARAREADDRHGEHACARFLARLAAATGHEEAARTWSEVALRAGAHPAD